MEHKGNVMIVKDYVQLNSKIVVAQAHKDDFSGEAIEVEKIAEEINIYGRVLNYTIKDIGNMYNITFLIE
jgi:hypothetical protein